MCEPTAPRSFSYITCTTSLYGAASLTNRAPFAFTISPPGRVRSARQKYGSPGSGIDGPHHASSISASEAPARCPARIPSPVFSFAPTDHWVPIGCCWYCARICALCSKPPEPTTTPRRARTVPRTPSFSTTTPVTAPPSWTRSTSGLFSHTGTPARWSPARSPAARDWPIVSGFSPRSAAFVPRARHSVDTARPLALTAARFSHL